MKAQQIKLIYNKDEVASATNLGGLEVFLSKPKSTNVVTPLFQLQLTVDTKVLAIHIQSRLEMDWRTMVSALALVCLEFDRGEFILGGFTPIYQASNILELDLKDVTFPVKYLIQGDQVVNQTGQFMGERYRSERPRSTRGERSVGMQHHSDPTSNLTEFSVEEDQLPQARVMPRATQSNHLLRVDEDKNSLGLGRDRDEKKPETAPEQQALLEPRPEWTDKLNDAGIKFFREFNRPSGAYIKQSSLSEQTVLSIKRGTFTISVGGVTVDKVIPSGKFSLFYADTPLCEISVRRSQGKYNYTLYANTGDQVHTHLIVDFMTYMGMDARYSRQLQDELSK